MSATQETFFQLVRLALGHEKADSFIEPSDWEELIALCKRQGLSALCTDGLQKLYSDNTGFHCGLDAQKKLRMEWFSDTVNCETEYVKHSRVIAKLAEFYSAHGLEMMVLKGYGLSLNYPVPQHRESGDIDIFLLGDPVDGVPAWKQGDQAAEKELGIKVDNSHHHHSVFRYKGRSIENHFDFINVYGHKSSAEIEKILKEEALAARNHIEIDGRSVLLPPDNLNAIFLAKHCALHFASEELKMRQVIDWATFVEKRGSLVDWNKTGDIYKKYNLEQFVGILNRIAVEKAGFSLEIFPFVAEKDEIYERVLCEIITPEFTEKEKGDLLSALYVKPRRWWANRWKHKLCYPDSLFSGFAHSLFAKILKPSHFIH